MSPGRLFWVLGALFAAVGCATAPSAPNPILFGRTQPLAVRTDPPGATCTLAQRGDVLATVESTPGVADVRRDFKWFRDGIALTAEAIAPLEIVCRKDGYLEFRRQVRVQYATRVREEEVALQARPEPTPAETAKGAATVAGAAGATAVLASPVSGPLGMALAASGGAVLAPVAAVVVIGIVATKDMPPLADYAYRPLPEFLLVPAQFESQASCDAFFADLAAKLRTAHDQMRARIDADCWFPPCTPGDASPCQDPWCQRLREITDADLQSELDRIPAARAQVRIGAAPE
jgi:hypothetical protein